MASLYNIEFNLSCKQHLIKDHLKRLNHQVEQIMPEDASRILERKNTAEKVYDCRHLMVNICTAK